MLRNNISVKLIGISGGSCSGKTTLETALTDAFGDEIALFPFDDLFVGRETLVGQEVTDWEDPSLYRWDDFKIALDSLRLGRKASLQAKSRESKNMGISVRRIEARPIVAVVGFLALFDSSINNMYDQKIFLDLPEETIIARRKARAARQGSTKPWDSDDYINNLLIPGHRKYVEPQRAIADEIVDATQSSKAVADEVVRLIKESQ